ncbi:MAG: recombinase family protein [Gordonia sp. (in: high G+C Gram-positive bacteria)]
MTLGYARESLDSPSLKSQIDTLVAHGVAPARVYSDNSGGGAPGDRRPGLDALLDYARAGDTVVVLGVDRLGRTTGEVLQTTRLLTERGVGVRALREKLDTHDVAGSMVVGVLTSLAIVDRESAVSHRRTTRVAQHSGGSIGRPRALDDAQVTLAERMRANGASVPAIAATLGVSRATLYRTLAERRSGQ